MLFIIEVFAVALKECVLRTYILHNVFHFFNEAVSYLYTLMNIARAIFMHFFEKI